MLYLEGQKGILKLKSLLGISSGNVLFLLRGAFFAAVTQCHQILLLRSLTSGDPLTPSLPFVSIHMNVIVQPWNSSSFSCCIFLNCSQLQQLHYKRQQCGQSGFDSSQYMIFSPSALETFDIVFKEFCSDFIGGECFSQIVFITFKIFCNKFITGRVCAQFRNLKYFNSSDLNYEEHVFIEKINKVDILISFGAL